MGILDTALQKLSNPSSNLAMAEDTMRDSRNRMYEAMDANANRAQQAMGLAAQARQKQKGREHETQLQTRLQDARIEAERGMQQQQLEHESGQNALDRILQRDLAADRDQLERDLQEAESLLQQMLQDEELEYRRWTDEEQRALEWKIAQLQAQLRREGMADKDEDDPYGDLNRMFFNELSKLHANPTSDDWLWDPNQERYVFTKEWNSENIERIKQQLFDNIDNANYSPEDKERLKLHIENNFMELIEGGEGSEEGGSGRFLDWIRGNRPGAVEQSNRAVEEFGRLHSMPTDPSGFGPGVPERVYNHLSQEYHPAFRGGSLAEKGLESDIVSTIERLRGQNLSSSDQGVVEYVENEFERARSTRGDDTATFRRLLDLLRPIEGEETDNTYVPGVPRGYGNYGR